MAETRAASGLTVQQWDDKFHTEYFQENLFSPLYGTGEMAPIQVREQLTKKKGDSITFAFLEKLTNSAVTGGATMQGAEEDLTSRSHRVYVDKRRNAVRVGEMEEQRSSISLRGSAKPALKDWADCDTRDLIITALGSIDGTAYASASEANKDTWLTNNSDRVLFGALISNASSLDHSTSLANVDTTNDKLTRANLSLLRRVALTARTPRIRPVKDPGNGKRYFIVYAHPNAFRDLKTDMASVLGTVTVEKEAAKLFEGGDLMWDGMIIKECDDLPVYTAVGASSANVSPVYLMGAQAIGMAWARRWRTTDETFDYGDKVGVEISGIFGIEKLNFGTGTGDTDTKKQHGVATGYFTSAADA